MTESVRDAVFGNVGTTISFRVSADDAPILSKQFEPVFEAQDLLNLNNRHFVISMIINGEKTPAFSATTLSIPKPPNDLMPRIVKYSRMTYARTREEVENEIRANIEAAEKWKKNLSDSGREAGERGSAPKEKPSYAFVPTPQQDFRKQKISPNAAEGGENSGNGLKNLGKIVAEQAQKAQESQTSNESPNIHLEQYVPNIEPEEVEDEADDDDEDEENEIDKPMITGSSRTEVAVKEVPESARSEKKRKKRNRNRNRNKNASQSQTNA